MFIWLKFIIQMLSFNLFLGPGQEVISVLTAPFQSPQYITYRDSNCPVISRHAIVLIYRY